MAIEVPMDQMTVEEKLGLVDELWLSMKSELDSLGVSVTERELLDERWEEFVSNLASALTMEEFQRRMKFLIPANS